MEKLVQIEYVKNQLKIAPRKAICALYKLIFEDEGDRKNRSKLREFSGFTFLDNSIEFREKLEFAGGFSIGDLTSICNILGLNYLANVDQLRRDIVRSLMDINSLAQRENESEAEDDKDDENDEDDVGSDSEGIRNEDGRRTDEHTRSNSIRGSNAGVVPVSHSVQDRVVGNARNDQECQPVKFSLGFPDVEDTIREFSGTDNFPIERWIADFEDVALLFEWTDLQKVVFAKRTLKGLAKLFVQSETGLMTWKKLKDALLGEFSTQISNAQLHAMLSNSKIKESESIQEYVLKMREISSRSKTEWESLSLVEYIIDGLGDTPSNKAILYNAKNINDFKERLKTYDRIINTMKIS